MKAIEDRKKRPCERENEEEETDHTEKKGRGAAQRKLFGGDHQQEGDLSLSLSSQRDDDSFLERSQAMIG